MAIIEQLTAANIYTVLPTTLRLRRIIHRQEPRVRSRCGALGSRICSASVHLASRQMGTGVRPRRRMFGKRLIAASKEPLGACVMETHGKQENIRRAGRRWRHRISTKDREEDKICLHRMLSLDRLPNSVRRAAPQRLTGTNLTLSTG